MFCTASAKHIQSPIHRKIFAVLVFPGTVHFSSILLPSILLLLNCLWINFISSYFAWIHNMETREKPSKKYTKLSWIVGFNLILHDFDMWTWTENIFLVNLSSASESASAVCTPPVEYSLFAHMTHKRAAEYFFWIIVVAREEQSYIY